MSIREMYKTIREKLIQVKRKKAKDVDTTKINELKPDKDGFISNPIYKDKFNYKEHSHEAYQIELNEYKKTFRPSVIIIDE